MVVGGREIEKVKEVIYLGYRFKWNGGQKAQIKERVRKKWECWGRCGE